MLGNPGDLDHCGQNSHSQMAKALQMYFHMEPGGVQTRALIIESFNTKPSSYEIHQSQQQHLAIQSQDICI